MKSTAYFLNLVFHSGIPELVKPAIGNRKMERRSVLVCPKFISDSNSVENYKVFAFNLFSEDTVHKITHRAERARDPFKKKDKKKMGIKKR
jgi:hypothetical protein